jgi:hypothetical protein
MTQWINNDLPKSFTDALITTPDVSYHPPIGKACISDFSMNDNSRAFLDIVQPWLFYAYFSGDVTSPRVMPWFGGSHPYVANEVISEVCDIILHYAVGKHRGHGGGVTTLNALAAIHKLQSPGKDFPALAALTPGIKICDLTLTFTSTQLTVRVHRRR